MRPTVAVGAHGRADEFGVVRDAERHVEVDAAAGERRDVRRVAAELTARQVLGVVRAGDDRDEVVARGHGVEVVDAVVIADGLHERRPAGERVVDPDGVFEGLVVDRVRREFGDDERAAVDGGRRHQDDARTDDRIIGGVHHLADQAIGIEADVPEAGLALFTLLALRARITLFALRALGTVGARSARVTGITLGSLGSVGARGARLTGVALNTLCARRAVGARGAGHAVGARGARFALRAGVSGLAGVALRAGVSLFAGITLRALRASVAGRSGGARITGFALGAGRAITAGGDERREAEQSFQMTTHGGSFLDASRLRPAPPGAGAFGSLEQGPRQPRRVVAHRRAGPFPGGRRRDRTNFRPSRPRG
jgi:hypothetical protein